MNRSFDGVIELTVDATDVQRRIFSVQQRIPVKSGAGNPRATDRASQDHDHAHRGLGRNTALNVARCGGDVILTYRTGADDANAVVAEIGGMVRKAVALRLETGDVSSFRLS